MSAYAFEHLYSEADPLLPSLDATVVLTMEGNERESRMDWPFLSRLARATYVQRNPGHRKMVKPGVDCTSRDIIHAYQAACRRVQELGHVLILEDDAQPLLRDPRVYARIDAFLQGGDFDVYSFGSLGRFRIGCGRHPRYASFMGFAQAIVYTQTTRSRLLAVDVQAIRHIDAHFLSRLARKRSYWRPVIVQLFPRTDNMLEWGYRQRGSACERRLVALFVRILHHVLCLDRRLWGWHAMYVINYAAFSCAIIVGLPLVLGCVALASLL